MRALIALLVLAAATACDDDGGGGQPTADGGGGAAADAEAGMGGMGGMGGQPGDAAPDAEPPPGDATPDMALPDATPDGGADPVCGDERVDAPETCDDGNTEPGDGCDADCQLERPVHVEPDTFDMPFEVAFDAEGVIEVAFELDRADDVDYFAFELTEPADLVIETYAPDDRYGCAGDTLLALLRGDDGQPLAENDDGPFSLCSLLNPIDDAGVDGAPPGRYVVEVAALAGEIGANVLSIRVVPRLPEDTVCHDFALDGRCEDELRCLEVDEETLLGVCRAAGCGDGFVDEGEECDDGNRLDGDLCTAMCRLDGPEEVEPNDVRPQATPLGDSRRPDIGPFQMLSRFGSVDDVDVFRLTVPPGGEVEVGLVTRDGFFNCPGVVSGRLLDGEGRVMAEAPIACDVWFADRLAPGDYFLELRTDDPEVVGRRLLTFAAPTRLVGAGEDCAVVDARCDPAIAYCPLDAPEAGRRCVAHVCGDSLLGPSETCDDGNDQPGDGCGADCRIEATDISAGGDFPSALAPGDTDLFAFTLDARSRVVLETSDGLRRCPGDTLMRLTRVELDETRTPLAESDDIDPDNNPCSRIDQVLSRGRYEVEVLEFFGEGLDAYVLSARYEPEVGEGEACGPQVAICGPDLRCTEGFCVVAGCGDGVLDEGEACDDGNLEDGDGCSSACEEEDTDVTAGGTFPGGVAANERAYFVFTLDDTTRVDAEVGDGEGGCPGDSFLLLERALGDVFEAVQGADDGGVDRCSAMSVQLGAGRWRFAVYGFGGIALPDFSLSVGFRPVVDVGAACGEAAACLDGLTCEEGLCVR